MANPSPQVQGPLADLALHTLGWKAFQDLCAQVCVEAFGTTVSIYRDAQDGGQDAVFLTRPNGRHGTSVEATVQCKFSSKAGLRLRASDVEPELATVRELTLAGRANVYYLITSLGVDAPIAAEIRDKLKGAGVVQPHVLGREWLTQQIRSSARLRALVPRVYGLGDLSTILDERCAQQTEALLGHLRHSLRVYVPTAAHRSAVRILSEHRIVLLVGAPAAGKSMLASILATTTIDGEGHECLKCDGPIEFAARWNPNERNRLYWIDDAFGPNQLRQDFLDGWISAIPKVRVALDHGNRFILTSRSHIWFAAKPRLGTRNLPSLVDGRAVVDLGTLSTEEREQIIYNHIKGGNQDAGWKQRIKIHLPMLAENSLLLPEIARRLGDRRFTKALEETPQGLIKFVTEPAEFLIETIKELDDAHQAAMTLVFMRRGKLPSHELAGDSTKLVADKYGVNPRAISESLPQLEQSFLSVRQESGYQVWGFIHPTFTDAISRMLSERPDLVELYVKGSKIETLLSEAVCEGAASIRDAVIIPSSASEHLVRRLLEIPDALELNRALFEFLAVRASDSVINAVLDADAHLLSREVAQTWKIAANHRVRFLARVHKLHRLPEELRIDTAAKLEVAAREKLDVSFLEDEGLLGLFQPRQLIQLGSWLVHMLSDAIPSRIADLAEVADPDQDIPDQFDQVTAFIDTLQQHLDNDELSSATLRSLNEEVEAAIIEVSKRKSPDDDYGSWHAVPPAKVATALKGRSMFSDVDE
jgi:hypothetical protein